MKSTPHIKPMNDVEIAETVLLPGDPLRAKFIAETYLDDVEQFNTVRNMFGLPEHIKVKSFCHGFRNGYAIYWHLLL